MKRVSLSIYGQVQGVFYRREAAHEAQRLRLSGFVRNETDGSVHAEAEGSKDALDSFIRWCRAGTSNARVDSVETKEIALSLNEGFEIRY